MHVICLDDNVAPRFLTTNKIYQVIEEDDFGYRIIDDANNKYFYFKHRFIIVGYLQPIKYLKKLELQ